LGFARGEIEVNLGVPSDDGPVEGGDYKNPQKVELSKICKTKGKGNECNHGARGHQVKWGGGWQKKGKTPLLGQKKLFKRGRVKKNRKQNGNVPNRGGISLIGDSALKKKGNF